MAEFEPQGNKEPINFLEARERILNSRGDLKIINIVRSIEVEKPGLIGNLSRMYGRLRPARDPEKKGGF